MSEIGDRSHNQMSHVVPLKNQISLASNSFKFLNINFPFILKW